MLIVFTQGLMQASEIHGFEGEGFSYLKSPIWWAGIATRMFGQSQAGRRVALMD
jgi:magnesium transporter